MAVTPGLRFVNHVGPFLYRPGERQLAARLFELLGCRVADSGGKYLGVRVRPEDAGGEDPTPFIMFATQATPEQLEFDAALSAALDGRLARSYAKYRELLDARPQESVHFAIRIESPEALEDTLEGIRMVTDPTLAGRVSVVRTVRRGDPDYLAGLVQAYVRTDVVTLGPLALGQHFELQAELLTP